MTCDKLKYILSKEMNTGVYFLLRKSLLFQSKPAVNQLVWHYWQYYQIKKENKKR